MCKQITMCLASNVYMLQSAKKKLSLARFMITVVWKSDEDDEADEEFILKNHLWFLLVVQDDHSVMLSATFFALTINGPKQKASYCRVCCFSYNIMLCKKSHLAISDSSYPTGALQFFDLRHHCAFVSLMSN